MALPSNRRMALVAETAEHKLEYARQDVAFIVGQVDSLCIALESGRTSVPQTPEQWRRCLAGITKGDDWENGTWK